MFVFVPQEQVVCVQRPVRRAGVRGSALHEATAQNEPAAAARHLVAQSRRLQVRRSDGGRRLIIVLSRFCLFMKILLVT